METKDEREFGFIVMRSRLDDDPNSHGRTTETQDDYSPWSTSTKERTRKIMVEVGLSLNVLSVAGRVAVRNVLR